jgi:hypothetical protein
LILAIKETSLEVNADKVKYMVMSADQNARRSHNMNIDNRTIEMEEDFQYLITTLTNHNCIQEEIKSRLNSENNCYNSFQNICLPVCFPIIRD